MRFVETELPGVLLIEPDLFRDPRGYFLETFHAAKYRQGGIAYDFVSGGRGLTVPGLPAQSAGCLDGT